MFLKYDCSRIIPLYMKGGLPFFSNHKDGLAWLVYP